MTPRGPTVESLALAAVLWQAMHDAGLIQAQLARRLGWTQAEVCRVIQGTRRLTALQVTAWLDQCNASDDLRKTAFVEACPRCGCKDLEHQTR